MQRLLSLLLIGVLMLSHGTMSSAALHSPLLHDHAELVADHHHGEADEDTLASSVESAVSSASDGSPHIGTGSHVHVAFDRVAPVELAPLNRIGSNRAERIGASFALHSMHQRPLLEPPSA
jgi:hypothetical protein